MKQPTTTWTLAAAIALLQPVVAAAVQVSVKDIATRPGVTQRVLLVKPEQPVASAILFAGGNGLLNISADGNIGSLRGNFLVRVRGTFAQQGLAVAVVDAPSDHNEVGLRYFRQSEEHAADIAQVIAFLRQEVKQPVWLVGTSRGTISAANVAIRLGEKGPDGIVLTSTILSNDREQVPAMDLQAIKVPALVVHHENDQCRLCPFSEIKALMEGLKSTPKKELIAFTGGGPVRGDPCEARHYHGYVGIEDEVVKRIADWIKANSPRRQ